MPQRPANPALVVIYGDDTHQKSTALIAALNKLLPPGVDRSLALTEYDGARDPDDGGPVLSAVLEDLGTLPFLADRRVVLIRDADEFITAHRARLEQYVAKPAPTGTLVLECRSFPRTTRLAKAALAAGGQLTECRKLVGRAAVDFVLAQAGAQGLRIEPAAAARLVDLVGLEAGLLISEIEKLCLYAAGRKAITDEDVSALVGQSREEKIFAVMDAAAAGRLPDALRLWHDVLATDRGAVFKVLGGMAYKIRQWLAAHRAVAGGATLSEVAPRLKMWRRERELATLLRRLPAALLRRFLAAIGNLDSQAKSGARSIETGVELMLVRLAAPAR